MKKRPYQDIWRDGRLVRKGRRECAERFEAISSELGGIASLVDIGGWDGYFARRFMEAGVERATLMEPRNVADLGGIDHLQMALSVDTVDQVRPHDAGLLLSVLHHLDDWSEVYDRLRALCRTLIVELAVPEEVAPGRELSRTLVETGSRIAPTHDRIIEDGETIATTPGPNGVDRPIVAVRNTWAGKVDAGSGLAGELMSEVDPEVWGPLGYEPVPGTLNVKVGRAGKAWVRRLPGAVECTAPSLPLPYWPVTIDGVDGHVRLSRAQTVVEVVAPVHLRDALELRDGDDVELVVR